MTCRNSEWIDLNPVNSQPHWHHNPGLPRAPQCPFLALHESLTPKFGKGFHTATGTIDTAITQVAPGADQIYHHHHICTQKCWSRERHHPGLPRAPQGPFHVSQECLAPANGKDFHTAHEPKSTAIPQVAPGGPKSPKTWSTHSQVPTSWMPTYMPNRSS